MGECQQETREDGNILGGGSFIRITEKPKMSANKRSIYSIAYECFDC